MRGDILWHFPHGRNYPGGREIYCYAGELINSPITEEPTEWCQTKGAEAAKPLLWKRKRRRDNFPPMRTNNSQDQQRRHWLRLAAKAEEGG